MNLMAATPPTESTPELRAEVRSYVERWKDKEGNLIMILHEIQGKHGFIPRDLALELARQIGIRLARIYEVLTFYHYFKLVAPGKHNITVCNGTACYLKGSPQIMAEVAARLGIKEGETTRDQLFHFETVRCIGCCGMAPAMVVDNKTIGRASAGDVKGLIDTIRQQETAPAAPAVASKLTPASKPATAKA